MKSTSKSAAYHRSQWEHIHQWVCAHRALISVHGLQAAAQIAARSPGLFPQRLREAGWDPLISACPSAEQLEFSLKCQRLRYRKR